MLDVGQRLPEECVHMLVEQRVVDVLAVLACMHHPEQT